jgi:flagellar motility protein MotE (MotC chaperone)
MEREIKKWEWFIYTIIFPLFLTIVLTGFLLFWMGYDFKSFIPDLKNRSFFTKAVSNENQQPNEELLKEIQNVKQELAKTKQTVKTLQEQLNEQKQEEAVSSIEETSALPAPIEGQDESDSYKEIGRMYKEMTPSKAAAILASLTQEDVVHILSSMNASQRAGILEKMDPKQAAELTVLLKDESN